MEQTNRFTNRLQTKLQPKAAYAANINMSPTHFYVSSLLLSIIGAVFVAAGGDLHWPLLLVCLVLMARLFCSHIAVLLICEHRMTSSFNIFMAELHDAIADALIYLPFAFISGVSGALVVATVITGFLCQIISITAVPIIQSRRHDGPIDSNDRILVFGMIALVLGIGVPPTLWVNVVLLCLIVMQVITMIVRLKTSLELSKK